MVSKVNPSVSIEIGGRERKLLFDLNAMATFEEATGKNVFQLDTKKLGARDLRGLLYACLVHEDENLSLKEVGSWITPQNMANIAAKLGEAFNAAMPEGDKKEESPLA